MTEFLSMYSEEEVVEIVEVLVPEEIVPEVIEVSPPLPNDIWNMENAIPPESNHLSLWNF